MKITFTTAELPKDCPSLIRSVRQKAVSISFTYGNGTLLANYDLEDTIQGIEKKIKHNQLYGNNNRWVNMWEEHLEILKGLRCD